MQARAFTTAFTREDHADLLRRPAAIVNTITSSFRLLIVALAAARSLIPEPQHRWTRRVALASSAALATASSPVAALAANPAAAAFASAAQQPPSIGLGTCCDEPEAAAASVRDAVRLGYRLIDTAAHYPSEAAVGSALADARQNLLGVHGGTGSGGGGVCVVTKIWFDSMGYEPALASAMRRREEL